MHERTTTPFFFLLAYSHCMAAIFRGAGKSTVPMLVMLPFMMVELCAYGLVAGLLRGIKLPSLAKVVIAQLAGRVVLTAATAIAVFAFGSSKAIAATWTSDLAAGLPGLALQWALIPLAAYWTESLIAKRNH